MSKIKSIFGGYADNLQVFIDTAKSKFAPVWYGKYFTMGTPKPTLSYSTIIGRSRIEAAASIVDRDSKTPLRSRQGLDKLTGEVPAIKEMFKMKESDWRDYLTIQALSTTEEAKKSQILSLIWNDVEKVGNAAHKRLDYMCLEAISTGFITVTATNNPDGVVTDNIDLLMASTNFKTVTVSWDGAVNATKPITDIKAVVDAAENAGKSFAKMLMTKSRFLKLAASDEARNLVSGTLRINSKDQVAPTLDQVNDYLSKALLPIIELVNEVIGIEKDGVITTVKPFKDENVSFIPDGKLGVINNALAIEELKPVENVSYGRFRNALISKWSENEPFGEFTKVEFNAFPGVEAIDGIFILQTTTTS